MGWVDAVSVAGFACLLATLLLYSAAAMPFQRFMNLPDFVGILGYALRSGVPAGVAGTLVVGLGLGGVLSHMVARVFFMLTFVVGNASFCAMALGGAWPEWTFLPVGICVGVGCLGELLAWGRILARYNLRQATGVVAASAVLAALVGWAQLHVGEAAAVALFVLCALACAALPFVFAPFGDAWAKSGAPTVEAGEYGKKRGTGITTRPKGCMAARPMACMTARPGTCMTIRSRALLSPNPRCLSGSVAQLPFQVACVVF